MHQRARRSIYTKGCSKQLGTISRRFGSVGRFWTCQIPQLSKNRPTHLLPPSYPGSLSVGVPPNRVAPAPIFPPSKVPLPTAPPSQNRPETGLGFLRGICPGLPDGARVRLHRSLLFARVPSWWGKSDCTVPLPSAHRPAPSDSHGSERHSHSRKGDSGDDCRIERAIPVSLLPLRFPP